MSNPWKLSDRGGLFLLALYNFAQVTIILALSYYLGKYRVNIVQDNLVLAAFAVIGFVGYAICRITNGWLSSTLGYLAIIVAGSAFLGADLASGADSTSYEIMIGVAIGTYLVIVMFLWKKHFLEGWLLNTISILPLFPVWYLLLPAIFPWFGLVYIAPNPFEMAFGVALSGGFIVMNMKKCYFVATKTEAGWSLNLIADSNADNVLAYFQWNFRGKIKLVVNLAEDKSWTDKMLPQLITVLELANKLKNEDTQKTDKADTMRYLKEAIILFGPDKLEPRLRRILLGEKNSSN